MRIALAALLVLTLAYAAVLAYVYSIQDALVFYPLAEHTAQPADFGLRATRYRVPTADGETLDAWYFAPPQNANRAAALRNGPADFVLLYSHGNAGNISHNLDSVRQFQGLGLGVYLYEYRGYGASTGQPTEAGLYRDADAAYKFLRERLGISEQRIIIFGRSLGGAVAAQLATRVPARALIIESTFTSAVNVAASVYWYLPVGLLARNRFESLERLRERDLQDWQGRPLPLLVIHSREDRLIPFAHGQRLFDAARTARKTLLEIRGGHNDGFLSDRRRYETGVVEFINNI